MGRQLRIVDGPDEVHLRTVAREEIRKGERPAPDPEPAAAATALRP
jgi:hypothetical protein